MKIIGRFVNDESGATAIEYGLIVALIVVGILTIIFGFIKPAASPAS